MSRRGIVDKEWAAIILECVVAEIALVIKHGCTPTSVSSLFLLLQDDSWDGSNEGNYLC
jgi:hypothetical protein